MHLLDASLQLLNLGPNVFAKCIQLVLEILDLSTERDNGFLESRFRLGSFSFCLFQGPLCVRYLFFELIYICVFFTKLLAVRFFYVCDLLLQAANFLLKFFPIFVGDSQFLP